MSVHQYVGNPAGIPNYRLTKLPMSLSFSHPVALWALLILLPLVALPLIGRRGHSHSRFNLSTRQWVSIGLRLLIGLLLIFSLAGVAACATGR